MAFDPTALGPSAEPAIHDLSGEIWHPLFRHECAFGPDVFEDVMMNLVKNPNINSSWLFRADILNDTDPGWVPEPLPTSSDLPDQQQGVAAAAQAVQQPVPVAFKDFRNDRVLVRRLIPRNTRRDDPLEQTCVFASSTPDATGVDANAGAAGTRSLVVYLPHASSLDALPFYHPKVRGVAHLHEWDAARAVGTVSIHYLFFDEADFAVEKLVRTARMLLSVLYKHGQGRVAGYKKRVHHDVVIPQARFQDRYAELKLKYARDLVESWAETTDPSKHVFEDLGIAAFLIELWAEMYKDKPFPGFVDIGCGNGLLVYILIQEGYSGWGFDARARKSWAKYNTVQSGKDSLQRLVLLPDVVSRPSCADGEESVIDLSQTHNGAFPKGTFIVSNHADELTPWTPILATLSESPFIMIPCCSHTLGGQKHRAPLPRDKTKSQSTYSCLVDWAACIAEDCGWVVETEMLRIPSTRNTAMLGRNRTRDVEEVDIDGVLAKYGGTGGYFESAAKLTKTEKGH
ncbi:tRNA (uracil-O(2)-)-methyltransferase [Colletotrichum gloeosporioides]|uniref:tRNA (uracil-O(2)-)-methyltransferase n=1 Tax=Colletotrichum gloeosporioides TaxID=474922 RepID=A0A8H4CPB8_COLGL|nr:tRNA (uracil-O(2)-)-methyltransferase [Colletotrichum gloeosporioides]KAF3807641.1 tRNA (uracil-O(2)-)-methyltransferase [Colletotrichum gloeosporioides]